MEAIIYVQLLDDGTLVYRLVSSEKLGPNLYRVGGHNFYDPEDENWEFKHGTIVEVSETILEGENVLLAVKELKSPTLR